MTRLFTLSSWLVLLLGAWLLAIEYLDLFEGYPAFQAGLMTATLVGFSVFLCIFLSTFILNILLPLFFNYQPSGLIRTIIIVGLVFAISVGTLMQLGFDIGAIFTTSAILGAIIGFALQPTLGSLVAGIALSSDRVISVGSMIEFEGHFVRIKATHWRHIYGHRPDGVGIVIPNSKLAQTVVSIYPEDTSTRFDTFFHLPSDVPPQLVTELLVGAFSDLDRFDAAQPVKITPWKTCPEVSAIEYRVRMYARDYDDIFDLKGEVIRRAWYVLNRHGICQPRNILFGSKSWQPQDYLSILANHISGQNNVDDVDLAHAIKSAVIYRFGPEELLSLPSYEFGRTAIIVAGNIISSKNQFLNPMEFGSSAALYLAPMPIDVLSDGALIRKISDRLAKTLGPVVQQLMGDGVKNTNGMAELIEYLALSIDNEQAKKEFLKDVEAMVVQDQISAIGMTFELARNALGEVTVGDGLRSISEVVLVTIDKRVSPDKFVDLSNTK